MAISNKEMKHLLAASPEEADKPRKRTPREIVDDYCRSILEEDSDIIPWEDIREATWEQTSITQDMRRMNTQRLMNEVRGRIETIAARHTTFNGALNVTAHQLRDETMTMLRRYHEMGALQNFRVNSIQQTEELGSLRPEVNMSVTLVPTASLERINISIRLTP